MLLVALTAHVYVLPLSRPLTSTGDATSEAEPDAPASEETQTTLNSWIALPFAAGATKATAILPSPWVRVGWAGWLGAPTINDEEATDSRLLPLTFVAWTVHAYDEPLVSALTVIGEVGPVPVPRVPPLLDVHVAVYPVIGLPPFAGATNATPIDPAPVATVGGAGAVGATPTPNAAVGRRTTSAAVRPAARVRVRTVPNQRGPGRSGAGRAVRIRCLSKRSPRGAPGMASTGRFGELPPPGGLEPEHNCPSCRKSCDYCANTIYRRGGVGVSFPAFVAAALPRQGPDCRCARRSGANSTSPSARP